MNEAESPRPIWQRIIVVVVNLLVCGGILGAAVWAIIWINNTEPVAEKVNATRKSAALVDTLTVERGNFAPRLQVLGTVQSAQQISLRPQVAGQVIELSPDFTPGGMLKKGDLVLRLDPADFENALAISNSQLDQAKASMEIEQARQRVAEKELKLLEGSIDETNRGLVMREPQIASAQAEVTAAEAAVERAKLDLKRTSVYAPFDAQVLRRAVNQGSQVRPGDELAQLIGLEEYWVMAAVPVRSLRWIQFPQTDDDSRSPDAELESPTESAADSEWNQDSTGSLVVLRNPDAWGEGVEREARVARLIGTLDEQSRLARVLISVPDPLGTESGQPPLILNSLLETEIEGRQIEDVVRLDRDLVRDKDTVWVMKDGKLEIRDTEIVFRDAQYAYIRSGLDEGEEVVTTTLATVAPGVGLRKLNASPSDADDAADTPPSGEAAE